MHDSAYSPCDPSVTANHNNISALSTHGDITDDATHTIERLEPHIEHVESFALNGERPWKVIAFATSLPLIAIGVVGATSYWSDFLVVALLLGGIAMLIACLRAGAQQETDRDALARSAYMALPPALLAQATLDSRYSERTRTLIANLLTRQDASWAHEIKSDDAEWSALNRAGAPGCGGRSCGGPVPPKGGFRSSPAPARGFPANNSPADAPTDA